MNFTYHLATQIEFGIGSQARLPELISQHTTGSRVFLVTDRGVQQAGLVHPLLNRLQSAGYQVTVFSQVAQNPRDTDCMTGADAFSNVDADIIVGIGGGSAMDTAKAIALLGRNGGTPADYADGMRLYENIAPVICLPTTAGTGSEVTRSSVITEAATHRKMTLKHEMLRPVAALCDPLLTLTVPSHVTAATGVDALVHAIEGYTCKKTNPISQALGARAMRILYNALPEAVVNGDNLAARSQMLEGSLLAGLCFGSADVAAVHCLAEALGGLYDTPHGVANAVFLPYVLKFNAETNCALHAELAVHMGLASTETETKQAVEQLLDGIQRLTHVVGIPPLASLPNVREADFPHIVKLAMENGSTASNVRPLTEQDYRTLLEEAYTGDSSVRM